MGMGCLLAGWGALGRPPSRRNLPDQTRLTPSGGAAFFRSVALQVGSQKKQRLSMQEVL